MKPEQKDLIETADRLDLISTMIDDVLTRNSTLDNHGMRQQANDAIDAVWDLRCDLLRKSGMEGSTC